MAQHYDLELIARQAMRDRGLEPDFPDEALQQVRELNGPAHKRGANIQDLRGLLWASIDNDDSRDLDQLTVAQDLGGGVVRVFVAIADVDSLVRRDTPVDRHAERNTTSVYTAAAIFPMLPERLSTDLTSLGQDEDRLSIVVSYDVDSGGAASHANVYRALVRNKAKLAYDSVAAWLDGQADAPHAMSAAPGVDGQIRLQDEVAERMRALRHESGALDLETIEARATVHDGKVVDLKRVQDNRAHRLIEDFMIAANTATAQFLEAKGLFSIRRVVRSPERWDRIRALAAGYHETLPEEPNAPALQQFLVKRRTADPLRFPDLSLTIVKLMGSGEYVVHGPGEDTSGHFGLAVRDYTHSTAPNRRFPDLITQRQLKAALDGDRPPYDRGDLEYLATHCTRLEDAAQKVERQVRKSAAALLLSDRIGERFDAIVTGANDKGVWARALHPPVEGKVVRGEEGLDVGDRVEVRLLDVDVRQGFIDFGRV